MLFVHIFHSGCIQLAVYILFTNDGLYLSLAAYSNMDNSDEESQNLSENSFNEMVTAAIGAGFAFVHMLHLPPQGNHVIQVPELTRR